VDHRFNTTLYQVIANFVTVVSLIAEELIGINVVQLHERVIALDFVRLAAGHIEGQEISFGLRAEVIFWWRSRRASGRAHPDFDSPFCADCMLMRPHRGTDGMFLVGRRSQTRECFERGIPHAELGKNCRDNLCKNLNLQMFEESDDAEAPSA
jgi:hypothetical protein